MIPKSPRKSAAEIIILPDRISIQSVGIERVISTLTVLAPHPSPPVIPPQTLKAVLHWGCFVFDKLQLRVCKSAMHTSLGKHEDATENETLTTGTDRAQRKKSEAGRRVILLALTHWLDSTCCAVRRSRTKDRVLYLLPGIYTVNHKGDTRAWEFVSL